MIKYTIKRLLMLIPILICMSIISFSIIQLVPGDPVETSLGIFVDPDLVKAIRHELGLDKAVYLQYLDWVFNLIRGNFGQSIRTRESIGKLLLLRFPVSLELIAFAFVFSVIISIPLGILASLYPRTAIDYISMGIGIFGVAMPHFWVGILLILLFGVHWQILPTSGYTPIWDSLQENLRSMILPSLTLSLSMIAVTMRMTRASLLEVFEKDYIKFLRAKGLRETLVIYPHAIKNAFIPVVTVTGLQFGYLLAGAIVIEEIFAIPGLGRLVLNAVVERDYPVVQATTMILAGWFVIVNLITDLIYSYLNPQIQLEGTRKN